MYSVSKMNSLVLICAMGLFVLLSVAGCNDSTPTKNPGQEVPNIVEYLNGEAAYSVLAGLLEGTTLKGTLSGNAKYTLLAPTDAAFAKLPEGYLDNLTGEQKLELLRYHVISGENQIAAPAQTENRQYASLQGDPLFLTSAQATLRLNNSAVITLRNRSVSNGVVHQVDEVLMPDQFGTVRENIRKRYPLNALYEQLDDLELTDLLEGDGHLSFVIPPAEIFEDIEAWLQRSLTIDEKKEIWKYNIVSQDISGYGAGTQAALQTLSGDSLYLTIEQPGEYVFNCCGAIGAGATPKIASKNGTIYQWGGLLLPDKYTGVLTLMDKRYYLTTVRIGFAKAKMTGRMYNALANTDEQFTVFIPKNGTPGLQNLPEDEEELAEILKYHVLIGKFTAEELQHNQNFTTWKGEEITITRNGDEIIINGTAKITLADLEGTNGVVHVIDGLLLP
jgi:transforming growth factor-beta-induced protein